MVKELIRDFDTKLCNVKIYKTDLIIDGEEMYVIKSTTLRNGQLLVRFGNYLQTNSIIRTYYRDDQLL